MAHIRTRHTTGTKRAAKTPLTDHCADNLQALSEFLLLACHLQFASRGMLDSLFSTCFGYLPLNLRHQTHHLQVLQELLVLGKFFKFCPLIGILVEQLA